jgi:hypothetical protein
LFWGFGGTSVVANSQKNKYRTFVAMMKANSGVKAIATKAGGLLEIRLLHPRCRAEAWSGVSRGPRPDARSDLREPPNQLHAGALRSEG